MVVGLGPQAEVAPDLRAAEVDRGSNANQITSWIANHPANLQDAFEQNKLQVTQQGRIIIIDSRCSDRANWLPVDFTTRGNVWTAPQKFNRLRGSKSTAVEDR